MNSNELIWSEVKRMKEMEFVTRCSSCGARVFIVGGYVRDAIRGAKPKDKDYVVSGMREDDFVRLFPDAEKVGKSFPVYLVLIDGEKCEVAFARRERKCGTGYRGFRVEFSPVVTIEDDLFRRDTTMNAIAVALPSHERIDPYGGADDIAHHIIRPVSEHFTDDPVRALRAARQRAELGFELLPETIEAMKLCRDEIAAEPSERIMNELTRALKTMRPSLFFRALRAADLLDVTFPEIFALIGKTQPTAFHPEGDAFEHTMLVVDDVASKTDDIMTRFSALVHDIGKGVTPASMLPHHYGHDKNGGAVLMKWNERMTLPREWVKAASFVIREHMRAPRLTKSGKIVRLLLDVERSPLTFDAFNAIIMADNKSLPIYLAHANDILPRLHEVSGNDAPEGVKGQAVGAWLIGEQAKIYKRLAYQYTHQ